jgi:hypothetical protein
MKEKNLKTVGPEIIDWYIEGQAFSRSLDLNPRLQPSPPFPVSKLDRRHTGRKKKRQLADGRGGRGWARSGIIQPQESQVLYKSF